MTDRNLRALLAALIVPLGVAVALSQSPDSPWQPHSLPPVQQFDATSQPEDVDEGRYSGVDGFLSRNYRPNQPLGTPGTDAPPQPLRRHPYGLALSVDESKLYVTLEGNEAEPQASVLVIDTTSRRILREIPVGSRPLGITRTPGGRYFVVANQYSNFLSVIDSASDTEVLRIPSFYYNQKILFVPERSWMLVTNRATDSLDVYRFDESPLSASVITHIPLTNDNHPYRLDDDPGYGLGGEHQKLIGPAPGFGNNEVSTPREFVRHLTNVNPRDLAIHGKHVFVANVNGLGLSVVDLDTQQQVASIDLNAPALDVVASGSYVFISTLGRFVQGFDDVHNELAVVDVTKSPFRLAMRYTSSANPPYGPPLGPGRGLLVPASGDAPYLSAFGVVNFVNFPRRRDVFLQIVDGFIDNPDNLPQIVGGALPDQLVATGDRLFVGYSASDEVGAFEIRGDLFVPATRLLRQVGNVFTNGSQTAFPTAIDRGALWDDGPFLQGKDNPEFFSGRMPQEMIYAPMRGRLFVANRLGESVAEIQVDRSGGVLWNATIDLTLRDVPPFPATLAEIGEDFYTTSRVSMSRDSSCLSCHPNINTDSKIWHVSTTSGRATRLTLHNRNLRNTAPFYRSGIRRNLETFRGTFRVMSPEGPFGFFEDPAPFDANGDGVLNDADRGRTMSDVNRSRMFVLERVGTSFERTSSAIAAFLESEPRLMPNPFLSISRGLSRNVPVGFDGSQTPVIGDAVRGQQLFESAGCTSCHPGPAFTNNKLLKLGEGMEDVNGDGIPDAVTLSIEQSAFDRLIHPFRDQYRSAIPREGMPFTAVDTDVRLHVANSENNFTPTARMSVPRSPLSRRLLVDLDADTRRINVPSLRNGWDNGPFLQHGRAADLFAVQTQFNEVGRHGDLSVLGVFDPRRPWANRAYVDLTAFLKSIE